MKTNCSRRGFLRGAAGAAGLIATSQLPAVARGRFEQLDINRIRIDAGASKPFSVLHISDTHLTLAYPHEDAKKQTLCKSRTELFGGRQLEALKDSIRWAKDNTDYLLHTGDLIDWVSEANLAAVKEHFGSLRVFGSIGNHEYSRYMWLEPQPYTNAYKKRSEAVLKAAYPYDIRFDARVINGINFVSLDDVYDYIDADQVEKFKKEAAKGLPIVLLMHVPFPTPQIEAWNEKYWSYGKHFTNAPAPDKKWNKTSQDFIEYLKKEPLLKGILAGHNHFTAQERFSPTAVQYIVGGNYGHVGQEVDFV